jgi:hypothetical protein
VEITWMVDAVPLAYTTGGDRAQQGFHNSKEEVR